MSQVTEKRTRLNNDDVPAKRAKYSDESDSSDASDAEAEPDMKTRTRKFSKCLESAVSDDYTDTATFNRNKWSPGRQEAVDLIKQAIKDGVLTKKNIDRLTAKAIDLCMDDFYALLFDNVIDGDKLNSDLVGDYEDDEE